MAGVWKTAKGGPEDGPLWRADLLNRPAASRSTSATAVPTTNTFRASPSPFDSASRAPPSADLPKDLTLFQFLDVDGRPSIVLRLINNDESRICHDRHVYENTAFHKAYPDGKSKNSFVAYAIKQLSEGEREANSFSLTVLGRPCTSTVIAGQWALVSWNSVVTSRDLPDDNPSIARLGAGFDGWGQIEERATAAELGNDDQRELWLKGADLLGWSKFPGMQLSAHQRRILEYPWHETSMGPIESWSTVLKLSVSASVLNPDPRTLYWGEDFVAIYNEHCIPIFGQKHPEALGKSPKFMWPETWPMAEPMMNKAMYEGKASKLIGVQCFFKRNDIFEETFFNSTFLPIPGVDAMGQGVLNQFSEVTDTIIAQRHQELIGSIGDAAWKVNGLTEYWNTVAAIIDQERSDVAYALIFTPTLSPGDRLDTATHGSLSTSYELKHHIGFAQSPIKSSQYFDPRQPRQQDDEIISALRKSCQQDSTVLLHKSDSSLPASLNICITDRGFGDEIWTACAMSIPSTRGGMPLGFVVIGMNPRRPIDQRSRAFVSVLRDSLTKGAATTSMPSHARQQQKQLEDLHQSLLQRLHKSDREVGRLKARFERMAGTAPVGMFMYTADGTTPIYVNDEYLSVMGLTMQQLENDGWLDMLDPIDLERVTVAFTELVSQHKSVTIEFKTKKDFQVVDEVTGLPISVPQYVIATCIPEFDEDGTVLNLQGWLINMSQHRFTQRLLSSRLEEVTASKQNAENFIDMFSHEMRNPLSAILQSADGIVSLLDSSQHTGPALSLDEETAESVMDASQTIILCAQHQKRIVDDILTLSKLDANLLMISPDKSNPAILFRKALKMFEAQLDRASIKAAVDILPSISVLDIEHVMMDSSRILQVIINLLTNAIKFTQHAKKTRAISLVLGASTSKPEAGDVHYIPRRESRPRHHFTHEWGNGQDIYLSFAVRDTGKGLTADEMKTLFQRFSQASPKTYKKYGGSGLGLFISRELTELQGGQIGVSSVAGKGSTFAFYVLTRRWLPCTPLSEGRRFSDIHTPTMLESPVAYSRRESAAMFDSTAANAVTLLGGAPGGDRLSPGRSPEAGMRLPGSAAAAGTGGGVARKEKMSILVVEDNVINQKVMAKQIRAAGHTVYVANHGAEALAFLRRTPFWTGAKGAEAVVAEQPDYLNQGSPPLKQVGEVAELSVILMDLEMPVLDGLSCVRQIRTMEEKGELSGHVPVIAVTANARSEQIGIALAAGMDEVVTKPFRIWQVLERAAGLVKREKSGPAKEVLGGGGEGEVPKFAGDDTRVDSVQSVNGA